MNFLLRISRFLFIMWFLFTLFLFFAPFSFSFSITEKSDKISHFFIAFFTSLLFYFSFKNKGWTGAFFFTVFYGGLVEVMQGLLPFRSFSIFDFLADIVGASGFVIFYFSTKNYSKKSY